MSLVPGWGMIKRTTRAGLVAAFCCLLPAISLASSLPRQGMTMDQVRQAYGAPARDMGAVGSPAITRWVYDGYTVYFERSRVVHVVRTQPLPRGTTAPAAPAPVPAPAPAIAAPQPAEAPAAPAYVEPAYVAPAYVAPAAVADTPASMPVEPVEEPAMAPVAEEPAMEDVVVEEPAAASGEPAGQPVVEAAPAAVEPVPAPAFAPASPGGGFRFDPVTGRLIIDSEPAESTEAPVQTAPAAAEPEPAPEPATESASTEPAPAEAQPEASEPAPADAGTATDDNLEFDPETGTFRPKR